MRVTTVYSIYCTRFRSRGTRAAALAQGCQVPTTKLVKYPRCLIYTQPLSFPYICIEPSIFTVFRALPHSCNASFRFHPPEHWSRAMFASSQPKRPKIVGSESASLSSGGNHNRGSQLAMGSRIQVRQVSDHAAKGDESATSQSRRDDPHSKSTAAT